MTQKQLGFVELEWTCQRCGTKNPGLQKTCTNCGAPMPAETEFELGQNQKLIEDQKKLEAAQKGPDIHCPYCGARNPAGATACAQCGGDLKSGTARQAGQVMGAHQVAPIPDITCPFCKATIKADAQRCPNCGGDLTHPAAALPQAAEPAKKRPIWLYIAAALLVVVCCGAIGMFGLLSLRTSDVRGQVQSVAWQRSIEIMEQRPAEKSDWQDQIPAGAKTVSCSEKLRETSKNPAPNSKEVCGTPYTINQGNGAGQVVQDCEYQIYDQYCNYTVLEWQVVDKAVAQGSDLRPAWPTLSLGSGQKEGSRSEAYKVEFSANGQIYSYQPADLNEFSRFVPGSTWTLKVNTFGAVNSVSP